MLVSTAPGPHAQTRGDRTEDHRHDDGVGRHQQQRCITEHGSAGHETVLSGPVTGIWQGTQTGGSSP